MNIWPILLFIVKRWKWPVLISQCHASQSRPGYARSCGHEPQEYTRDGQVKCLEYSETDADGDIWNPDYIQFHNWLTWEYLWMNSWLISWILIDRQIEIQWDTDKTDTGDILQQGIRKADLNSVLHLLALADSWFPDGWAGPSQWSRPLLSPARCRDHLLLIGGQAWSRGPLRQSQASWGQVWPIRGQHQSTSLHSISNFMPVDIRSKITRNTCLYKQDISP